MLYDNESALGYSYISICKDIERSLFISSDHLLVECIHQNDQSYFYKHYVATSRFFEFDIEKLDAMVESIIGQRDYGLTAYFNEEKELVIAYRKRENDEYREQECSLKNLYDQETKDFINSINNVFIQMRYFVFE
jgi:hypothetical protein